MGCVPSKRQIAKDLTNPETGQVIGSITMRDGVISLGNNAYIPLWNVYSGKNAVMAIDIGDKKIRVYREKQTDVDT